MWNIYVICAVPLFYLDKNSIAGALARLYEGVHISIDAVVTDVLINGTSPVSLAARELYDFAVAEYAQRKMEEAGKHEILDVL